MANKANKGIVIKRGILGVASGSYNNIIVSKNNVIRHKVINKKTPIGKTS